MRPVRLVSRFALLLVLLVLASGVGRAAAQEAPTSRERLPELRSRAELGPLLGRPVVRIEVVGIGQRWVSRAEVNRVRVGDPLSPKVARVAMQELTDTGRYADVSAEAEAEGDGAVLRILVVPRRIVSAVRVVGGELEDEATLSAASLKPGQEVTSDGLDQRAKDIVSFYETHGFPNAEVRVRAIDTDDPMRVVVIFEVHANLERRVSRRRFIVKPSTPEIASYLDDYGVATGQRADREQMDAADEELQTELRSAGWRRARVSHRLPEHGAAELTVFVQAGARLRPVFEGNHAFDADQLTDALAVEGTDERSFAAMGEQIQKFYVDRGFLDAEVKVHERGGESEPLHDLVFSVRENERVRVVEREYPCLTGERTADDVGEEIDSFLSEALPGADFIAPVDPGRVDRALGPGGPTGARVHALPLNPWSTYDRDVYDRAIEHLRELYRSEGYLSAMVGPVVVLRRQCDPRSPPGKCITHGQRERPETFCPTDEAPVPAEDPPASNTAACRPDRAAGIRCEDEVVLHIPIKLGPRATLWDATFEGNDSLVESELNEAAGLDLGGPVSQVALEKARLNVLDEYAEEGFAFARVDVQLDLSPDRTRARARFVIAERERVRVRYIVVRGARLTNESLILGRVALEPGEFYRRSLVRSTEERLATLGVFSSVTVGLEDPEVPAREKVVVITVVERPPQYLDVRPGFSTGEGVRIIFEYGHRNLGGEAIQLTLRVRLSYLPDPFILDNDVRRKYEELALGERLERRNTASVEFPEIGLGPLFRLGVDGVDVRDNARDFGLTKGAGLVTLSYRPTSRFTAQVGGSLERNNAQIFGSDERGALIDYLNEHPEASRLLRVPQGTTFAVAQRTLVTWDRRDNPFGATRGTYSSLGVEHVRAVPIGNGADITSQFLRFSNRVAGYIPLDDRGLSVALSFSWGLNTQLRQDSRTYPDRLFYFGGVDSIRGFLQDSVIPQDIAEQIEATANLPDDDPDKLTRREVVVRGGDFMMNPRGELRIPLGDIWQTALFLDAGNLWVQPKSIVPYRLRYAAGTGLRATTPIGPLALDIGFNLDRRAWEDRFAFHFSIGLF